MIKESKYIIRRVIVGVLITIILSFINSCEVHAEEWKSSGASVTDITYTRSIANIGNSSLYSFTSKLEANCTGTSCSLNTSNTNFYLNYVQFNFAMNEWLANNLNWKITNTFTINHPSFNSNDDVQCSVINGTGNCVVSRVESTKFKIEFNGIISGHYFAITLSTPSSPDLSKTYDWQNGGDDLKYFQMLGNSFNSSYNSGTFWYDDSPTTTDVINNQNQNTQDIINSQNNINNSINDSSIPSDSDSKINNIVSSTQTQNANISELVNFIPNTLQVIINGFNNSCTGGYSLGSLFGTELVIPCINPVDYLGSFLWGVIDSILCLCYLIPLCKFLVNKYNDLTSLKNLRWQ